MKTGLARAAKLMRHYKHQGIEYFWDIEGITEDADALQAVIDHLVEHCQNLKIDYVVGFDARGFLFGGAVAHALGAGFKQIRKKGKLPGPVVEVSYQYEYGSGVLELQDNGTLAGKHILLIDDVFATGGTAKAGIELVEKVGGIVVEFVSVIEMPELGGRLKLCDIPVHSCISIIENTPVAEVEYCVDLFVRDSKTGSLLLVERLTEPAGNAMPGGRIEPHESAIMAAMRELKEETGASRRSGAATKMLVALNRDSRGPKVSVVCDCMADCSNLSSEPEHTRAFLVKDPEDLPSIDTFAFDHGQFVFEYWPRIIAEEALIEPTLESVL